MLNPEVLLAAGVIQEPVRVTVSILSGFGINKFVDTRLMPSAPSTMK